MTLLCFSLVFHYNHVFCGVCNVWAISGLAKQTAEHPGRQVGNKNYIIGKLQIFFGLISFSSESAFKMWAGGIGCPAIKTTLSGNICEQSQQCIVSRKLENSCKAPGKCWWWCNKTRPAWAVWPTVAIFLLFQYLSSKCELQAIGEKKTGRTNFSLGHFFSSMSDSARVEKVINLGLSIFKYL